MKATVKDLSSICNLELFKQIFDTRTQEVIHLRYYSGWEKERYANELVIFFEYRNKKTGFITPMTMNIFVHPRNGNWSYIKYHAIYGSTSTVGRKARNRFIEYLHLNGWEEF